MPAHEDGWESIQLVDRAKGSPLRPGAGRLHRGGLLSPHSPAKAGAAEGLRGAAGGRPAPAAGPAAWLRGLTRTFGSQLLALIFLSQHLMKGLSCSLIWAAAPYLLRSYHVPAQQVQIMMATYTMPWVLKPVIGLISDVCPINGYNKGPYMFCTCVLGAASSLLIGLVPHSVLPVHAVVLCLGFIMLEISTNDLMTEAFYAREIQAKPESGPDLLTFVFFGVTVAGLASKLVSAVMIETLGPPALILATLVPAVLMMIYLATGCMREKQASGAKTEAVRRRFWGQKECCALSLVMLVCTLCMATTAAVLSDPVVVGAVSVAVAGTLIFAFSLVLAPVIAKFAAFSVIQSSLSLSVGAPTYYFMTDTLKEYAGGPHFSVLFCVTILGSVGALCSLVGLVSYNRYSKTCTYRNLLLGTNLVASVAHFANVLLFSRLNLRLGIPDYVFALGTDVVGSLVGQWQWMPQMALFSMLCPKGMEATMFALIIGSHSMGISIASNMGSLLLEVLSCNPQGAKGEDGEFANLWKASLIASALPLVSIVLLFRLIPDARQDESMQLEDATTGSLWRRWRGEDQGEGSAAGDIEGDGPLSPAADSDAASCSPMPTKSSSWD